MVVQCRIVPLRYAIAYRPGGGRIDPGTAALHPGLVSKKNKSRRPPADGPVGIGSQVASWRDLVIVCRKCGGRLKGGFGEDGRDDLRSVLRDGLRAVGRKRDVRVIETGCLGICPKGAVVAIRGSEPGRILLVPQGQTPGRILETLGVILPGDQPPA
jgi:hypothetical protein